MSWQEDECTPPTPADFGEELWGAICKYLDLRLGGDWRHFRVELSAKDAAGEDLGPDTVWGPSINEYVIHISITVDPN